jgi:ABC-type multidrug transport system ATPase subunit
VVTSIEFVSTLLIAFPIFLLDSPPRGDPSLRGYRRYTMDEAKCEAVRIAGLRKSYGGIAAVDGLDLSIARGEIFGLLGPNGAGKSTTIECALGTKRRDSGAVSLLGLDPERDRKRLFERVGVQFQESGYQDRIKVDELCELTASLYSRPADYRALLARFGLGAKGVTVFLSSHYMDEVEFLCDRIAILKRGKIVAQGTPAELVAANGTKNLEEAFLLYMDKEAEMEEAC